MSKKNSTPPSLARKRGLTLDDDDLATLQGRAGEDVDDRAAQSVGFGIRRTKPTRHDRKYVPSGHELVGDRLYRKASDAALSDRASAGDDRVLLTGLRDMLDSILSDVDDFTEADRKACAKLYEQLHGHPIGESWRAVLARVLREQAQRSMQRRITGAPSTWPREMTAKQILVHVREQSSGETLPKWLTEAAIASVLPTINIGGKGGKGKTGRTPEDAVRWMAENAVKPATARRRGYSKG